MASVNIGLLLRFEMNVASLHAEACNSPKPKQGACQAWVTKLSWE